MGLRTQESLINVAVKHTAVTERLAINIAPAILAWFDQYGRKNLPWQQNINPYRVWLSEIMLQQTQVATVIPYFENFTTKLPTVHDLAHAEEDLVMHLWTGLGYYSRARNLHKAAKMVVNEFAGTFPCEMDDLIKLPGVGRSTAAAIRSIAFQQPAAILDGNVKRVLARLHAVDGWPGKTAVLNTLWEYAEAHAPEERPNNYSQAMMDLGATLCSRSKPACNLCPIQTDCLAFIQGNPSDYPGKKPKKVLPVKQATLLMIENNKGELLLTKRPPTGIWASLWVFPELEENNSIESFCEQEQLELIEHKQWPSFRHTFSHYHLEITPIHIKASSTATKTMEAGKQQWYHPKGDTELGLAAPIKKLIKALA